MHTDEIKKSGILRRLWSRWSLVIIVLTVIVVGLILSSRSEKDEKVVKDEVVLATVSVKTFAEIVKSNSISKVATLEPATNAPLVARAGGRVTDVLNHLGDSVKARSVVVAIDGSGVANPAQAQVAAASASLKVFKSILNEALKSADVGVEVAQLNVDAAKASKSLTAAQVSKAREQADLGVRQAELALNDVQESENKTDALERSANLALSAAELAQDQATIAKQLAGRQASDGLKQAEQGLNSAKIAKEKLIADLESQRVALSGQLAAASEQVKLAQVTTPVDGQVTRLTVREGDFVRPGQVVGEVTAFNGARITVNVATGVRSQLKLGQQLEIESEDQEFTGEISHLADGPSADSALWQVEVFVVSTPRVVQPGDLVSVKLPVGRNEDSDSVFIPLDVVTVRQDGVVLFTVSTENIVKEHLVTVTGFSSDFVEGLVELGEDAVVVVEGNRLLRSGDEVSIR